MLIFQWFEGAECLKFARNCQSRDKKDVKISLRENTLTVRGEGKEEKKSKKEDCCCERVQGSHS